MYVWKTSKANQMAQKPDYDSKHEHANMESPGIDRPSLRGEGAAVHSFGFMVDIFACRGVVHEAC
jgi:hypothetical protein